MPQILGTPAVDIKHGSLYTAEASASPRKLFYLCAVEGAQGSENAQGDVLFGSIPFQKRNTVDGFTAPGISSAGQAIMCEVWFIDDADIPAGQQAVTINGNSTTTGILVTVEGGENTTIKSVWGMVGGGPDTLSATLPNIGADNVVLAIAGTIYSGRTFTWTGLTKLLDGVGGASDFSYSAANITTSGAGDVTVDGSVTEGDSAASFAIGGVVIGDITDLVSTDNSTPTFGDFINLTSTIVDATSAVVVDAYNRVMPLPNLQNLTGGTYRVELPALVHGGLYAFPGECSLQLTNGSETAITPITLIPGPGIYSHTATAQFSSLEVGDWGFAGPGGLDNAVTPGDVHWATIAAGVDYYDDGRTFIDNGQFSGGTLVSWLFDAETGTVSKLEETYNSASPISNIDVDNIINPGQTFDINFESNQVLEAGQFWVVEIAIGQTVFNATVNSQTDTSINVTVPANLPTASRGTATLYVHRMAS